MNTADSINNDGYKEPLIGGFETVDPVSIMNCKPSKAMSKKGSNQLAKPTAFVSNRLSSHMLPKVMTATEAA